MDLIINSDDFKEINEAYFQKNTELLERMDILTEQSVIVYDKFGKQVFKNKEQRERMDDLESIENLGALELQIG